MTYTEYCKALSTKKLERELLLNAISLKLFDRIYSDLDEDDIKAVLVTCEQIQPS